MKLSDPVYNFLKWFALICLPALAVLISVVLPVWHVGDDLVKPLVITINAVGAFIGALIGVSQISIAQDDAQEEFIEGTAEDEDEVTDSEITEGV